jgi:dihydrodipicolinate synthase/N-acetylneuraminate lyase
LASLFPLLTADNIHPKLAVRIYDAFQAGNLKEAMQGQEDMNRVIAVLLKHCRCSEKGTNIVAGIKCVYKRKYGIDVGVAKPGAALVLSEDEQTALMRALEGLRFE